MLALALESALDAEARELLTDFTPDHDTAGIPDPPVKELRIPRGGVEN